MDDRLTAAGRPFNYHARDAAALLDSMRAMIPQTLSDWTGYDSEADFGMALLELFAHMGDIVSYYVDAAANESFLGTAQTRQSVIEHLRLIGYRMATATAALTELTVSVPKLPETPVVISTGDAFSTEAKRGAPAVRFEYTGTESIPLAFRTDTEAGKPIESLVRIPVVEGKTVTDDVLGSSDGTAYQRFPLTYTGVILRTFAPEEVMLSAVSTQAGEDHRGWRLRETLAFSGPADPDFTVEVDENDRAVLVFGPCAPRSGAVLRATYRVGGGELGNVAAGTITRVVTAAGLAGVKDVKVTNTARAIGGAPRESTDRAIAQAPAVFRSLGRAVTADDFVALALAYPGVGKARVRASGWNSVQLIVAPEGGGDVNDILRGDLIRYFEDKRPIGTRVEVVGVTYVPVFVSATVDVEPYFSGQRVADQVRAAVRGVLAFDRVGSGEVLYLSKFFEAIEAIDGVAGVNITQFARHEQDSPIPANGKLTMSADELPRVPEGDEVTQRPHPVGTPHPSGIDVTTVGGAT
jgi:Baseplate J-like protein